MVGVEDLVEGHALLNRAVFPPAEVDGDLETFNALGLAGGASLVLQVRGAGPVKGGAARRVRRHVTKPRAVPTSEMAIGGGRLSGALVGSYTFEDRSFSKAGMLVLCFERNCKEGSNLCLVAKDVAAHTPFLTS